MGKARRMGSSANPIPRYLAQPSVVECDITDPEEGFLRNHSSNRMPAAAFPLPDAEKDQVSEGQRKTDLRHRTERGPHQQSATAKSTHLRQGPDQVHLLRDGGRSVVSGKAKCFP